MFPEISELHFSQIDCFLPNIDHQHGIALKDARFSFTRKLPLREGSFNPWTHVFNFHITFKFFNRFNEYVSFNWFFLKRSSFYIDGITFPSFPQKQRQSKLHWFFTTSRWICLLLVCLLLLFQFFTVSGFFCKHLYEIHIFGQCI